MTVRAPSIPVGYVKTRSGLIAPYESLKQINDQQRRHRISFESADDIRRTESWLHPSIDPISLIGTYQPKLRDRARDLARNAPWMQGFIITWKKNAVGAGFNLIANPSKDELGEEKDEELAKLIELTWKRWRRGVDVSRRESLAMFMRLAEAEYAEVGEYFIHKKVRRDGRPVPLALELLPTERLDPTFNRPSTTDRFTGRRTNRISNGIEFDKDGARIAYHFDPIDDYGVVNPLGEKIRVPADEICHRYLKLRAGQERGVPPAFAALLLLRDVDSGIEYELEAWQGQSRFVGSIHHKNAGLIPTTQERDPIDERPIHRVAGAALLDLDTEEQIKFAEPTHPNPKLDSFMTFAARTFGVSVGFSYEAMTGDYSKVNFASGRLGHLGDRKTLRCAHEEIDQVCLRSIYSDFFWLGLERFKVRVTDFLMDPDRYLEHSWIYPGFEHHDPGKEVVAAGVRILLGLSTRAEECAALGKDWEEIADQLEREIAKYNEKGIPIVTVGGSSQITGRGNSGFDEEDAEQEDEEEGEKKSRVATVQFDRNVLTALIASAVQGGDDDA